MPSSPSVAAERQQATLFEILPRCL